MSRWKCLDVSWQTVAVAVVGDVEREEKRVRSAKESVEE